MNIQKELLKSGQTIILALSGGPDSIYLLHQLAPLHQSGEITIIAAHLDHEWRDNSANDVLFCRNAVNKLGIELVDDKLSNLNLAIKYNGSQEEIGRKARRYFLEKVCRERNGDRIALAHHYDDQQETFFIRLLRGATITGLAAMQAQHGLYIRPLLQTKKSEIIQFLDQHAIAYLTDPTNNSSDYLRNRIRHTILPALRQTDDRFDITFLNSLSHIQETERYLNSHTELLFKQILTNDNNIHIKQLLTLDPFMQQRLIMHWLCLHKVPFTPSNALIQEILRFLRQPHDHSHTKTHVMHSNWFITKKQNQANIEKTECASKE